MNPIRRALALLTAGALLVAGSSLASAAPVCHTSSEVTEAACGLRIFAEPLNSTTFVQHDPLPGGVLAGEYELGIKELARRFPRFVKVNKLTTLLNEPLAKSYGGREIWVIEVTDFNAPEAGKLPIAVSMSVHGAERAGLEGGVRYAEDLARWGTSDPGHLLRNGTEADSTAIRADEALRKTHLYLSNINPDGWSTGDLHNGGLYVRGNDRGVDLNREFPTIGWSNTSVSHLSEPEAIYWKKYMDIVRPKVASDLHGEVTSVNNAFADLMIPAGQWNPVQQAQEARLARHMTSNVYRYFAENNVVLGTALAPAGIRPADYATGYDVVGYDAAGFMGDWYTQAYGALEIDVEHFLSHMVPNSEWFGPLEQAHVAAVRGEIETLIVDGLTMSQVEVDLNLGAVGYVFDPAIITDADGYGGPNPPAGYTPMPYSVTPMRYFDDLSGSTDEALVPLGGHDIVADDALAGLDTLVMINPGLPVDPDGAFDQAAAIARIRAWVEGGGNLILTDEALTLLDEFGIVQASSVTKSMFGAGHIDTPPTFSDAYTLGLHPTDSQTYYEVPLGYSLSGSQSPHWTVATSAWTAGGGTSVATIGSGRTGLGRVKVGQGTIGIFGAILPPPTEKFDHFYGLADHAVTVAAGQILNNMIRFSD